MLGNDPKLDKIFRKEYSQLEKSDEGSYAYCGRLCNVYDSSWTGSVVFRGICSPSAEGGRAESVESYWSCVVVGRRCFRRRSAGRFGENEDLDGFLESVNRFDFVFGFCFCWTPADDCVFM